jgi:radical SAM/Cys-rich protein
MASFSGTLAERGLSLHRSALETLQLNLGRKCNQACRHCHVDAAPWRTEMMDKATAHGIAQWIRDHRPPVIDITGGAPELSEWFRYFVELGREVNARVIDRNNLTILEEPGFEDLPDFLASMRVEIIASLPCYLEKNVSQQRGHGVFEKSISALRKLNAVGYGQALPLHLVYNPIGPTLPPPQEELECDYKDVLHREYGIVFNRLLTITNQPIARFAEDLRRRGEFESYVELLVNSFNPATIGGLMCRSTLSVGYQGEIYDCDFNQMLAMQRVNSDNSLLYLWDINPSQLLQEPILVGNHCFACTAGSGSSCTGALALDVSP